MSLFKKKLSFAAATKIEEYQPEVDRLLRAIARYMIEEGESVEEWANCTFVSDDSTLADFLASEDDLLPLALDLQIPTLQLRDFIWEIAASLRERVQQSASLLQ